MPLATAVTLNYTSAIFLALYLALAGLRMRRSMLGALVLGLAGVILLLKPTLHAEQLMGGLIGLGSGVLAGMAYFSVRELGARGEPETRTVFYFSLVATLCSATWLVFGEIHPVDRETGPILFGVAAFATLAQLAMTRAFSRGKTMMSAALAYSTVIFSSLFGSLQDPCRGYLPSPCTLGLSLPVWQRHRPLQAAPEPVRPVRLRRQSGIPHWPSGAGR